MITTLQQPSLLEWAGEVLRVKFDPSQSTWISRLNTDGSPAAVVVYTRFSPHNCEMSIATDGLARWASREFIRVCYRYPFEKLKLARVSVVIEQDNALSMALAKKLGHVHEGTLKQWFGAKDGIVLRMLRSECRWL